MKIIKARLMPFTLIKFAEMFADIKEALSDLYKEKFPFESDTFPWVIRDIIPADDLAIIPDRYEHPWRIKVIKGEWSSIAMNETKWTGKCFAFYGFESHKKPIVERIRFTLGARQSQITYIFNINNAYEQFQFNGRFAVLFEEPILYGSGTPFNIEVYGEETGKEIFMIKGHVIEQQGYQMMGGGVR